MVGCFDPAIGGNHALPSIQTNDDMPRELLTGFGHELRLPHGLRADDHVTNAYLEVSLNGRQIPNTTTHLNRNIGMRLGDFADDGRVDGLALNRAVQIDDMAAPAT